MRELTLSEVERLGAFDDAERTFQMNEEAFRVFYEQTARPVWLYLARMTGDARLADDLLQESFYRFLRVNSTFESDDHRRNYLYRIATNLVHDHRRRPRADKAQIGNLAETAASPADMHTAERVVRRIDLARALDQLKPRERSMLWLAYAQGWTHEEIAASLGLKAASLKALMHRARKRLLTVLADPRPTGGRS